MAIPRAGLLAILGALLVAAAFLATRGSVAEPESAPPANPAPAADAPPAPAPGPGSTASQQSRAPQAGARKAGAPARKTDLGRRGRDDGLPAPVARALARRETVVLFLDQRRGADDAATRRSVNAVRDVRRRLSRRPGVAVFSDRVERLADYRKLIDGLGVSQAPAVAIVGPSRRAKLIEGYVDERSLMQEVRDAARGR